MIKQRREECVRRVTRPCGWTSGQEKSIEVTADDIERLGLSAPAGFNVPGVNVTDADKDRCVPRALHRSLCLKSHLIECINQVVLESHPPHKIVILLFTNTN